MIDSLSLNTFGSVSLRISVTAPHVLPPSVDSLTRIALSRLRVSLKDSEIWYASPSGPKLTHGSVARS